MTYAPVAFFCYSRLDNSSQTIDALKKNIGAEHTELFAFSDAARSAEDAPAVAAVRKWLHSLENEGCFKAVHVVERPSNFGLTKNITSGIADIFSFSDRVIILEDDIVTSPFFLQFMNNALEEYKDYKEVMMAGGYSQLNIPQKGDVYFSPHAQIWGWATWADRWKLFHLYRSRAEAVDGMTKEEVDALEYHGNFPLLKALDRPKPMWGVSWNVVVHRHHGFCLSPTCTLVHNIGQNDGTNYNKWMKYFGHYKEYPYADHLPDVHKRPIAADEEIENVLYPAALKDWGFEFNFIGKILHTLYLPFKRMKEARAAKVIQGKNPR